MHALTSCIERGATPAPSLATRGRAGSLSQSSGAMSYRLGRIRGNLVVREGEASAAYRFRPRPGTDLLDAALTAAGDAELTLHWVGRPWSFDRYAIGTEAAADVCHAHRMALAAYLGAQREPLEERAIAGSPEAYLYVRLPAGAPSGGLHAAERDVRRRLLPWLGCERASEADLRWLARMACSRGLPGSSPPRPPRGRCSLSVEACSVRVRSELGTSHQAFLTLGGGFAAANGQRPTVGELLAPLELAGHSVDIALRAAPADRAARAEGKPISLRASLSLRVAAPSAAELEERVELLRAELEPATLHRPSGDQLSLFLAHLPGRAAEAPGRAARLTPARLAPMLPRLVPELGTENGPYIGHRVDGPRRAVRFDAAHAAGPGPPCVLVGGAPGSGRTVLMQVLMHQAFLTGAAVCDVDLHGDHVLHRLPGVREHARVIELSGDPCLRGCLDPLRIAPPALREELACALLLRILGGRAPAEWRRALLLAVRVVIARGGRCGQVIEELDRGSGSGAELASALAERAASGPALLALGVDATDPPEPITSQLTVLRIPGLERDPPAAPWAPDGEAPLHGMLGSLLALYGLQLGARDRARRAVLGVDPDPGLLSDRTGTALLRHLAAAARAHRATVLLATGQLDWVDQLEPAVAALFCLRARSSQDAAQALRTLGLDDGDRELRRRIRSFGPGRCLMRDQARRTGEVQIDVPDPDLAAALGAATERRPRRGGTRLGSLNGEGA